MYCINTRGGQVKECRRNKRLASTTVRSGVTSNVSEFQERVYSELTRVPKGKVTTYKWLAKRVGCASPRAVGQALRRNPFAPWVPCHRVIASDMTLGGFRGRRTVFTLKEKFQLLADEGVCFENGKLSDARRLHVPERT